MGDWIMRFLQKQKGWGVGQQEEEQPEPEPDYGQCVDLAQTAREYMQDVYNATSKTKTGKKAKAKYESLSKEIQAVVTLCQELEAEQAILLKKVDKAAKLKLEGKKAAKSGEYEDEL